jgi:ubiquinone/menaquinone biosynthesis C-methylase UbiE
MKNDEVVGYYDSIASSYDESRFNNSYGRFVDAQERRVMDQLIDPEHNTLRLEMACGTGRLTNYATHGLDASSEMMAYAQERHPEVELRQASAAETGYEAETFDVVYSFHLMMHLDEDTVRQIIDEAWRILKPGGRFIFDIPSRKRRQLLHHRQASWHGGTQFSTKDVVGLVAPKFALKRRFGVMMLPVHKLPVALRKPLQSMDYVLANSWLREYSSYLIFELVKQ